MQRPGFLCSAALDATSRTDAALASREQLLVELSAKDARLAELGAWQQRGNLQRHVTIATLRTKTLGWSSQSTSRNWHGPLSMSCRERWRMSVLSARSLRSAARAKAQQGAL